MIDSVSVAEIILDSTQQNSLSVWEKVDRAFTAPTAGSVSVNGLSGKITYSGSAIIGVAATTVVSAKTQWFPIGNSGPIGGSNYTGSPFRNTTIDLKGGRVIVPGGAYHIAATKLEAKASSIHYVIRWHEVRMTAV